MKLICGDCVEEMRKMPEASVDAIVCDPPYDLTSARPGGRSPATEGAVMRGFMGLQWDGTGVAFQVETWREALRVLKPGGHLLAFGGTRTFHRLACAIEDAGFEIRDCLMYMYGSGFPKSLDVSKAIDKAADYRAKSKARREAVAAIIEAGLEIPQRNLDDWTKEDHAPGDRWWAEFIKWIPTLTDEDRERVVRICIARGQSGLSTWFARGGEFDITAPATPEAARWEGWGTALKPAWEPIIMARKPLAGTVAENVLEHGTGGINVGGCRIGTEGGGTHCNNRDEHGKCRGHSGGSAWDTFRGPDTEGGRWPPNVVLSHTPDCRCAGARKVKVRAAGEGIRHNTPEGVNKAHSFGRSKECWQTHDHADASGKETVEKWECVPDCPVRLLDEQSGESRSSPNKGGGKITGQVTGFPGYDRSPGGFGDSGGAARFFYCAKASRWEREAGLQKLPERGRAEVWGDGLNTATKCDPKMHTPEGVAARPHVRNHHPTVKPVALMRWLCRLVTPPGGIVLDPFVGSGTTGMACVLEGFDFIGIEKEREYLRIAERRIDYARANPRAFEGEKPKAAAKDAPGQDAFDFEIGSRPADRARCGCPIVGENVQRIADGLEPVGEHEETERIEHAQDCEEHQPGDAP